MISSKNIRFHAPSNTYIIPKNSVIDQNVTISGDVIVGPGVHFWKNIKVDGVAKIGKGCIIEGNLKANRVIVGSYSKIKGNISADSDVSLFQNAFVRSIESGGNITIMQNCAVGYANGKRLEVIGKAAISKIGAITKVTVRAEIVNELESENDDEIETEIETEIEAGIEAGIETGSEIEIENKDKIEVEVENEVTGKAENENKVEDQIKKIDVEKSESLNPVNTENEINRNTNLDSNATPIFQMENSSNNAKAEINAEENAEKNSEENVEIIDMMDENSPKSFSGSFVRSESQPIDISADEIEEVEIIEESTTDSVFNEPKTVPKTVETPFGTIVVGEQAVSDDFSDSKNLKTENCQKDESKQFASVIHVSREKQQADYEAEMKIGKSSQQKSFSSSPSSPQFSSPSFPSAPFLSPLKSANRSENSKPSESAELKTERPRWPAFEPQSRVRVENSKIQYESIKADSTQNQDSSQTSSSFQSSSSIFSNPLKTESRIEKASKIEETQEATPKQAEKIRKANQKIVFEEISAQNTTEDFGRKQPAQKPFESQVQKQNQNDRQNLNEKQEQTQQEQKERQAQAELEKSKLWYEDRYQSVPQKKKEYPPYI